MNEPESKTAEPDDPSQMAARQRLAWAAAYRADAQVARSEGSHVCAETYEQIAAELEREQW